MREKVRYSVGCRFCNYPRRAGCHQAPLKQFSTGFIWVWGRWCPDPWGFWWGSRSRGDPLLNKSRNTLPIDGGAKIVRLMVVEERLQYCFDFLVLLFSQRSLWSQLQRWKHTSQLYKYSEYQNPLRIVVIFEISFIPTLQLPVHPVPLNYLPVYLQLTHPVLFPLAPCPLEHPPVRKIKHPRTLLQPIHVLPLVPVPVGPSENALPLNHPINPISSKGAMINVSESSFSVEMPVFELSLVNSRVWYISAESVFDSIRKLSLIIRAIRKLLFPFSRWYIPHPLTLIIVTLKRITVFSIPVGIVFLYLPFIHAPIIEDIPSLPVRIVVGESSLIVRSILKVKFPFSMEFSIFPLSNVEAGRGGDLDWGFFEVTLG